MSSRSIGSIIISLLIGPDAGAQIDIFFRGEYGSEAGAQIGIFFRGSVGLMQGRK